MKPGSHSFDGCWKTALSLAGFLAFAGLIWLALRPAGTRLTDGTYLRVLAVTSGPNHSFATGERYSRRPFIWLPTPLLNRLDWRSHGASVWVEDAASTLVWFTSYDPREDRLKPRTFNRVELVAADGTVLTVAAQAPFQVAGRQVGLLFFPGLTNLPPDSRLRLYRGVPLELLGVIAPE
jgi:hypothetical protein